MNFLIIYFQFVCLFRIGLLVYQLVYPGLSNQLVYPGAKSSEIDATSSYEILHFGKFYQLNYSFLSPAFFRVFMRNLETQIINKKEGVIDFWCS